jgi:hypothetical protein
MNLSDLYRHDRDEQAMVQVELETIANMLDGWREGGKVDPDFAHYAGMTLLAIAQRAAIIDEPEQSGPSSSGF